MKKDKRTAVGFIEQMYEPALLNFYSSLPNPILIEDNAPVRTANYARKQREEHGFEKLKRLAQSPGLNPIENFWYQVKTKIKLDEMDLRAMKGLKEIMRNMWD
ncbi:hypothetical protein BCV72DRAFT_67466 [Rhizopus microsporus var. microsporus]|uniref:Tc1-like transposase DDE domain-containing protein n=1 Tax=Rhizopus microsporus var. microsporus TaxID=86635 RepID=A0A1X0QPS1_RHIZD|nr:hypothetical protein BCV72DRAFT_67466 [Rhizopus microsporus var. microsporus]